MRACATRSPVAFSASTQRKPTASDRGCGRIPLAAHRPDRRRRRLPVASLVLYLLLGAPGAPTSRDMIARRDIAGATAAELIARVERRLEAKPDDVQGWRVIAPIYLKLGRYQDAAEAYKRLLGFDGETPANLAGFADATIMANDGIVRMPHAQLTRKSLLTRSFISRASGWRWRWSRTAGATPPPPPLSCTVGVCTADAEFAPASSSSISPPSPRRPANRQRRHRHPLHRLPARPLGQRRRSGAKAQP